MKSFLGVAVKGAGVGEARYRRALTAALVVTIGVGGVACGSDSDSQSPHVDASQVCDGIFAGRLENTLQAVAGGTLFGRRSADSVERVIQKIKEGYASDRSWLTSQKLCEITVEGESPRDATVISFSIYAPQDVGDPGDPEGTLRFPLGKEAVARTRSAGLYFECVSPQVEGSKDRPVRIRGGLGYAEDRGDAVQNLVANLTVLHAASIAVARELECEEDGGLPERLSPDLQPLP
ncbi:hypothetical protein [Streptomyces pratensis]|uniref:hypothetical protein n=1 Tax=Streptomyces pratensis TaxID=1169025 RepID=UPI00301B1E8D